MTLSERRFDIDWLRVIAIGLLLLYHVAIGFQPWGRMIGFITNPEPWGALWTPMAMLNVWRIPLLFFVSGMGVYFAIRKRNWKQLFSERSRRILVPYLFGIFAIVPLHAYLWQVHYGIPPDYNYNPGHLWFLGNIFAYVILLSPFFVYLRGHENGTAARGIKKLFSSPWGLLLVTTFFVAEAMILKPLPYEMYALTWHGFFLGLLAFFFGFCFVMSGSPFWQMMLRWRWVFLAIAIMLFTVRIVYFQLRVPVYLLVPESQCWIFAVFAFGYKYLNRPGKTLRYLSEAAYPVYIIHMAVLYAGSMLIFPLNMAPPVKFAVLLAFTLAGCMLVYELVIRRIPFLRPLFGMKRRQADKSRPEIFAETSQLAGHHGDG